MLETRNVFIDTQSFVKAGLHFDGQAFKTFRKYCENRQLFHFLTSVVEREVKSKIELSVKDAISSIQTFRRKARLLSTLEDEKIKGLFEDIPDEEIYKKSEEVFIEFLKACSTQIVTADEVCAEDLLSLYFNTKPPFGDGKKKSEFPDAISLLSLKSQFSLDEKIYVISEDQDLINYCAGDPAFISVESLGKLLDIYTNHSNVLHQQVKQYVLSNYEIVKEKIVNYLEGCDVYNYSTWEDAEVDDGLVVIKLGDIDPSVLSIDDQESQVTFDIDVEFAVTVTGPDFNNGIYDREEGRMYTFGSTSRESIIYNTFNVEISLSHDFIDGKLVNVEIHSLYIPKASSGIEVFVEENQQDW